MQTTTYDVRVLGRLWMPQCLAATEASVNADKLPEFPQATGETDQQYECRMVECALELGDFSGIEALEIIKRETRVTVYEHRTNTTRQTRETFTTLQEFTEAQDIQWCECMFPEWADA